MTHPTNFTPLQISHLPLYLSWFNSDELQPYLFPTTPHQSTSILKWLKNCLKYHNYHIIYCQNKAIGHTGLKLRPNSSVVELSIIIADPSHRHVGHGHACLDFQLKLARQLGYHSIFVEIMPTNYQSIKFFLQAGFDSFYPLSTDVHSMSNIFLKYDLY